MHKSYLSFLAMHNLKSYLIDVLCSFFVVTVDPQDDYNISCLIMVYIAVSLRVLVRSETTIYSPVLDAHPNNCHCFAKAINAIAGALFTLHGRGDVEQRLQEFLAVSFLKENLRLL